MVPCLYAPPTSDEELPPEDAERRAKELAQRMLTTPKAALTTRPLPNAGERWQSDRDGSSSTEAKRTATRRTRRSVRTGGQ